VKAGLEIHALRPTVKTNGGLGALLASSDGWRTSEKPRHVLTFMNLRIVAPIEYEPDAHRPDVAKVDVRRAGGTYGARRMWYVNSPEQLKEQRGALVAGK